MKLKSANVMMGGTVMQFRNTDVNTGQEIPLIWDQETNILTATLPDGKTTRVNLNLIPVLVYEEDDGRPLLVQNNKPKLELVKT